MQNEKQKVKTIVKGINDNLYDLVINRSCGPFVIGEDIRNYLQIPHDYVHSSLEKFKLPDYDFYDFYDLGMCVYMDENNPYRIHHIICDEVCLWDGKNIIGMLISDFIKIYDLHPILENGEPIYVLDRNHHNTQRVFEFMENVGLMVWTWRNRIVSITVSRETEEP